jgi:hypothetical protein
MKFEGKVHKVVVELTILSATPPDDAGFDMTKSGDGEFARMRVVSREELSLEDARKLVKDLGGDPEAMK